MNCERAYQVPVQLAILPTHLLIAHSAQVVRKVSASGSMGKRKNSNHLDKEFLSSSVTLSGDLLGKVFDSLDSLVYIADQESEEILYANRAFQKVFGFNPRGRNSGDLIKNYSAGVPEVGQDYGDDTNTPGFQLREYQYPLTKKWYLEKVQDLEWSPNRWLKLVIARDITEQKQLASFLREARKHADGSASVNSRYVALVAHDLKSPFHSIISMLQRILKKETFDHEIHQQFLENIINNGERMLKMIDSLLDIHRLDRGQIRLEQSYFNLHEAVRDVFDNYAHPSRQKELHMVNNVPEKMEIFADKNLYSVVLNNLISNAVKFSFEGGRVEAFVERKGDRDILVVKDEGKGIARKMIDDIFRPEVNTTQPGTSGESGSGLGLIFCQQIMKAHGGCIRLKSREGAGARFYVELCPSCRLDEGDDSSP